MSKHTPGPWEADVVSRSFTDIIQSGEPMPERQVLIATASQRHGMETARANARLIAAAPEMLDELRKLANEAAGMLFVEGQLNAIAGITNVNAYKRRIEEARALIARIENDD